MKNIIIITLLFGFGLFASFESKSQNKITLRIDSLFSSHISLNSPGAAVAVIKEGKTVFSKSYGMADLEHNVPLTSESVFHTGSESKQYTAFCIVLLAKEGKLRLDDDIRKYLPYVPDFGKTITIRQLIQHISGLRDQWQLLAIGGQWIEDVIKQEHILKLVSKQKTLNFEPGTTFLYCNTGYTLLAEIVKKVSGKSLRQYADENIFKPLKMANTHFHDDNTEIVKNRVCSYRSIGEGKFAIAPLNYATVGPSSLFTTVEDEAKWLSNYETGKVGGKVAIAQMYEQATLNNGKKLTYAFGIWLDTLYGYQRIGHGGADAGYTAYAVRFPELGLGVIVFGNSSHINPYYLAKKVATFYLPERTSGNKKSELITAKNNFYKFFNGSYYSSIGNALQIIDSNRLYVKFDDMPQQLVPLSDTSFTLPDGQALIFQKSKTPVDTLLLVTDEGDEVFRRLKKPMLTDSSLTEYIGNYRSDELTAEYSIFKQNGALVLRHRKYPDATLEAISRNQFLSSNSWMSNILFQRNVKDEIISFEVNCHRIFHLVFRKESSRTYAE